jgi:hypothetical protein
MKTIKTIFHCLLYLKSFCLLAEGPSQNCLYKLNDGSFTWGEHLETYEDRWFYQEDGPEVSRYELLFKESRNQNQENTENIQVSPFHFYNQNEINKEFCWTTKISKYEQYLSQENLYFKNNLVENAYTLTGNEGHHKHEAMYGNFAWDIGIIDLNLSQFKNTGTELKDYYVFGAKVISPLKGTIIGAVTDQDDNDVDQSFTSDLSEKTNNYLTIQTSQFTYLSVVHFKKNTVTLKVGDKIKVGTYLGEVGNSGVSYLPHLHYTLYTYSKKLQRFVSIPGKFKE